MDFFKTAENINISPNDLFLILKSIAKGGQTFSSLLSETNFSKETLRKFNDLDLTEGSALPRVEPYILNNSGKTLYETAKKYKKNLSEEEKNKIKEYLEYCESVRPEIKRDYDHFICTIETKIKRVEKLLTDNILFNQSILFVGDNDLTSIALALVNLPMRICVVDIDRELLTFIKKISDEKKLNIETFESDLTNEFPKHLTGGFDIVFSDPPYTPNGFMTFLDSAIRSLLLRGGETLIYACYGTSERSPEKFLPIQEAINKFNLEIREVLYKFNYYTGAESIGNSSNLYILKPTEKTKSIKSISKERFYTNE